MKPDEARPLRTGGIGLALRIRYFGFLANRRGGEFLPRCRALLTAAPPADVANATEPVARRCPLPRAHADSRVPDAETDPPRGGPPGSGSRPVLSYSPARMSRL